MNDLEPDIPPVPTRRHILRRNWKSAFIVGILFLCAVIVVTDWAFTVSRYIHRSGLGTVHVDRRGIWVTMGECTPQYFSVVVEDQSPDDILFTTFHELSHCVVEPRIDDARLIRLHALWVATSNSTGYVRSYSSSDEGDYFEWIADQVATACTKTGGLGSVRAILTPELILLGCVQANPP